MPERFCSHLEEYGVLFIKTEAAYQVFNTMMDRAVSEQDETDLCRSLEKALEDWQQATRALRDRFLELFNSGRILLPKGALAHGNKRGLNLSGHAKCSDCYREIPRLVFPEWQLAHNGAVNFRGEELDLNESDLTVVP